MKVPERLRDRLHREFALDLDQISPELRVCIERLETLEEIATNRSEPMPEEVALLSQPSSDFPVQIVLVTGDAARREVFRLRYESFLAAGWIEPSQETELRDSFDALPTTVIVAAQSAGRLMATLRIALRTPRSEDPALPCELEFPAETAALRSRFDRIAEFSRIAIDPGMSNTSVKATLYGSLVRTGFVVARIAEIDYALAAVHTQVSAFYRHMIGFKRLATATAFGNIEEPTHLLGCEGSALFTRAGQRSNFFQVGASELASARRLLDRHHPEIIPKDPSRRAVHR